MNSEMRYVQGIGTTKLALGCWVATVKLDRDSDEYVVTVRAAAGHEQAPEETTIGAAGTGWVVQTFTAPEYTYYTDDKADAVGTAKLMLEERNEQERCPACLQRDADALYADYIAESADMPDGAACPACGGAGVVLGTLGDLIHLTCRDCGIGFQMPVASN